MLEPSGDHTTLPPSTTVLFVIRVGSLPSARITYTSVVPSRVDTKAMRDPSGDHAPPKFSPWVRVSRIGFAPSALMTKRSSPPSRADVKSNREPSGDH